MFRRVPFALHPIPSRIRAFVSCECDDPWWGNFLESSGRHIFMASFEFGDVSDEGAIVSFAKKPRPAEIGRPSTIEAEENIHLWPRSNGTFRQVENKPP